MTPDIEVELIIRRPREDVRAWWLEFPDDYRASDPREQPRRIVTLARDQDTRTLMTYWRVPPLRDVPVREVFHHLPDGNWWVDVRLPFGLRQRDDFRLESVPEGTRVRIEVSIWATTLGAKLARPLFMTMARRDYAKTWREAARICERDAPRTPAAGDAA